jgi:hypothetical protein
MNRRRARARDLTEIGSIVGRELLVRSPRDREHGLPLCRVSDSRASVARLDAKALPPLAVAGLFAGIAGMDLGLQQAGHQSALFCENDPGAREVLRARFPGVRLVRDIRAMKRLPPGSHARTSAKPAELAGWMVRVRVS